MGINVEQMSDAAIAYRVDQLAQAYDSDGLTDFLDAVYNAGRDNALDQSGTATGNYYGASYDDPDYQSASKRYKW